MIERIIAKRYAQAILNLAQGKGVIERIKTELVDLTSLYTSSDKFKRILNHPVIPRNKKSSFLSTLIGQQADALTLRFLELLIKKDRIRYLPEITEAYAFLADLAQGIMRVKVKSFSPLKKEQKSALVRRLNLITDKQVILETEIDRHLLGGLLVQMGDTVIDGSVANKLEEMKEQLLGKTIG